MNDREFEDAVAALLQFFPGVQLKFEQRRATGSLYSGKRIKDAGTLGSDVVQYTDCKAV